MQVKCGVLYSLILTACSVEHSEPPKITPPSISAASSEIGHPVSQHSISPRLQQEYGERFDTHSAYKHVSNKQTNRARQPIRLQLRVERMLVARDVKQRRAIGAADVFPSTVGSLWSLASVKAKGSSAQLEMRWWHGQELVSKNPFVVSEGIRWSEWSQITVRPTDVGAWRVEVFYPKENRVLRTRNFKIEAHQKTAINDSIPGAKIRTSKGASVLARSTRSSVLTPSIKKLEIARSVKRRRPLGVGTRFSVKDERLWGYIEVSNLESPIDVWMEWLHQGEVRSKLRVRVGVSKRWRTWSWQRLSQGDIGQWEVKVISSQGETLAHTEFSVER